MNKTKEMNKRNFEASNKLKKEYEDLYLDIVGYIRFSELTESQSEEAINDILDIMLSAQERGEDVFKIIGEDYKRFCSEVIESFKEKGQKLKSNISMLPTYVGMAILFIGLDFISQKIDEYVKLEQ